MKSIEKKGKDLNTIIRSFRKEYKVKDWELKYDILSEASNGFLGIFGKKEAKVRFNLLSTEERIKAFVEELLKHLEIRFDSVVTRTEYKTVYATINNSSDAGFLIGKNGSMLEQLQYLVNRIFENVPNLERIYLDTEDYRLRQEQAFLRPFIPTINKVKTTGKSVTLEPMQAGERRIIHKYVEGDRALKTLTIGEGDHKRIVVMLSGQKEPEPRKTRAPLKKNETKKPAPAKKVAEKTPEELAQESYKRHNAAHPGTKTAQRPRRITKTKKPTE